MNVVRLIGSKKFLTTIFGIALLAIGIQFSLTPKHIAVSCDIHWAPEYHTALKKRIERLAIRTIGASQLQKDLIKEYPCIKDITITYLSTLQAQVKLVGWRPLVVVRSSMLGNKDFVVCEKGHILEKTNFTSDAMLGMPTISISGSEYTDKLHEAEFIDTALKLKSSLFDTYTITWHSKTIIELYDEEKKIQVTADIMSVHDLDRYAYIQRIYAQEKKYKKGMKADIRLKDSIVCAPLTQSSS